MIPAQERPLGKQSHAIRPLVVCGARRLGHGLRYSAAVISLATERVLLLSLPTARGAALPCVSACLPLPESESNSGDHDGGSQTRDGDDIKVNAAEMAKTFQSQVVTQLQQLQVPIPREASCHHTAQGPPIPRNRSIVARECAPFSDPLRFDRKASMTSWTSSTYSPETRTTSPRHSCRQCCKNSSAVQVRIR